MNILAMAAHPDDVELSCAGTLALLSRSGHDVGVSHMTVGDKGGTGDPDELARTRAAEAKASCDLIGARYVPGFCGDLELYDNEDHLGRLVDTILAVRPDIVFTHTPLDYHPDHRITGELVIAACTRARELGLPTLELWWMDNLGGVDFGPEVYVDIAETFAVKRDMLRCHESQISWMTQVRHTDMEYVMEWMSQWRGLQCGVQRAEGYRLHSGGGDLLTSAVAAALLPPLTHEGALR